MWQASCPSVEFITAQPDISHHTQCVGPINPVHFQMTSYPLSMIRDLMSHFQLPILPHGHFHMHTVTMLNPTT